MERARGEYSPRALQKMRSASRSPNKRSVTGERCCDEQEQEKDEERQAPVRVEELLVRRESGGGGSSGGFGVFGVPPPPPPPSSLVTPFKRFRADSLISPSKAGSSAGGSGMHGHFARRRTGPVFQSLSRDQSAAATTTTSTRTAIMAFKRNAAAADHGVGSDRSTQQSSQQSSRQNSQQNSQQSSQGDSMLFKGRECSPADVAELGSELLVCSETLEDQMDALDVGSFLSWRASPLLQARDRAAITTSTSSSSAAAAAALRHRRKPRIRFDDDASYEIGLQDVFGEQTQVEEDPLDELEDPLEVFVHLPSAGCCNCLCPEHHDDEDLERSWQVPSPPPDAGFDPKSCSLYSDFDSEDDTVNESPFDAF